MPEAPPTPIARFRGAVRCRRATAPLGLTLSGRSADHPDEELTVGFAGVGGIGVVEGFAVNVLRVVGQMAAHGRRQIDIGSVRHCKGSIGAPPPG